MESTENVTNVLADRVNAPREQLVLGRSKESNPSVGA